MKYFAMNDSTEISPYFSVIMVTFNAEFCIERSLNSLKNQKCKDWELRVVDGGSSDNTLELVKLSEIERCIITSKRDAGIYDAMNYGITTSNGRWLYFLNAGDELSGPDVLEGIKATIEKSGILPDVVYGDIETKRRDIRVRNNQLVNGPSDFIRKIPLCHQSVFYKRSCFDDGNLYDTRYAVCADYHHLAGLSHSNHRFVKYDGTVAVYALGGYSHKKLRLLQVERFKIVKEIFGNIGSLAFAPFFVFAYCKAILLEILEPWKNKRCAK